MEKQFRLTIDSLVYEGSGMGRLPEGKAVFIPFVLPGEEVIAETVEEKRGYVRARLISVEKPHPRRIQPCCIHFGICGGCHYQHIPYDLQLEFKQAIFREQLQRMAGLDDPFITNAIPSKNEWIYRDSLQFGLDREAKLCFADIYTNELFPVHECHLPMQEIGRMWPQVDFEPGLDLDRIEFRQNWDEDLMLVIHGKEMPEMSSEATMSIVHIQDGEELVIAGDDHLTMTVRGRHFDVSAGAFFQTNFSGADALVESVISIIEAEKPENLLDVYCGVGLFSAFLADKLKTIVGVEYSPSACSNFSENLDEFDNVSLYQGRAEQILPGLKMDFDCILVDPPRSGLKKEVTHAIIENSPELLIYVSCNPATFARDTKHFISAGYNLESSTLVDMFPQTFHIELVNLFKKRTNP